MALSKFGYPWVADDRPVDAEFIVRSLREEYRVEQARIAKKRKLQEKLAAVIMGRTPAARFRTKVELEFDNGQYYSTYAVGTEVWIVGLTDTGDFRIRVGTYDAPLKHNNPLAETELDWDEVANDLEPIE